jgi:antitoxin component of MazEF toxin-antitoxin module
VQWTRIVRKWGSSAVIVLPKALRREIDLQPGTILQLTWQETGDSFSVRRLRLLDNPPAEDSTSPREMNRLAYPPKPSRVRTPTPERERFS